MQLRLNGDILLFVVISLSLFLSFFLSNTLSLLYLSRGFSSVCHDISRFFSVLKSCNILLFTATFQIKTHCKNLNKIIVGILKVKKKEKIIFCSFKPRPDTSTVMAKRLLARALGIPSIAGTGTGKRSETERPKRAASRSK